jgi:hypothetical protein
MRYASSMTSEDDSTGRTLIRWSAVFAGTLLGLATLALLSSLWLALARASSVEVVEENLEWFLGGSAVFCLFLAGLLAGYLSGVRGAGTGFLHGATLWGLLLLVTIMVGIPAIFNVFNIDQITTQVQSATTPTDPAVFGALWGTFWTILGGFIAAGLGGTIGGAMTRSDDRVVRVDDEQMTTRREPVVEREPVVVDREPVVQDEDVRSTR